MYIYVSMYVYVCIMYIYICMYVWMDGCTFVSFRSVEVSEASFQVSRHLCFFTVRGREPLAQPPTWRIRAD
jgi:hypothetical protein